MTERWTLVRRWWRQGVQIALLVLVLGGLIYWLKLSPMKVVEHRVERGSIVAEVMGTGTLEAHVKTTVSSKISGRIVEVLVDQGDRVTAGQLLVRLDEEELKQQVATAQANLETAREAIDRLKADRAAAMPVFDQAKKSYQRAQRAWVKNAISQADMDKATEALAVAKAGLSRANAAIAEARMKLVAAEKTMRYHRARLADTEVKAPFDGLIVRRQRDHGDVVVPGSAILTLISTDELWISAWVDETEMAKLQEGQPARVVFRSEPDRSYPGKVVRLGREADRETREFIVDVGVLQLPENWAVGHRAEVYIQTARKDDVTLLPAKYVVWQEDRPGVFVSGNGYAEWRGITFGLRSPEMVEVTNGLETGETVAMPADPRNTLSDGQRIRP
jgi:HlyD family secretion protein